jgi:hypothetical protein
MGYVGQMQASGIMGGVGDNRFAPQGRYTIEQSITTMLRVFELIQAELCEYLQSFISGMDLDYIRYRLGVNFTISAYEHSFDPWLWAWRGLNFDLGFDVFTDLDFELVRNMNSNVLGTQTGEAILLRNGDTEMFEVWIDVGNSIELNEGFGAPIPDWMTEDHRGYHIVLQVRLSD